MAKSKYPFEIRTLGDMIRKSRMDKGWTLLKVADGTGISESYLARIEAGKQIPNPDVADKIAKFLGENPTAFIRMTMAKYFPDLEFKKVSPTAKELEKIDAALLPNNAKSLLKAGYYTSRSKKKKN